MSEQVCAVFAILMGISALVLGILVQRGRLRHLVTMWDSNRHMPKYIRNGAYAYVPAGIAFLLVGLGILLGGEGR